MLRSLSQGGRRWRYSVAMVAGALFALALSFQAGDLPARVNLRPSYTKYQLTVCNQSGPLCWDYTLVGLAEYEFATQKNKSTRLSPGFLSWAASATDSESGASSNFGRAYRGLERYGLAPLNLGGNPDAQGRGLRPDGSTLRAAAGLGRFDFHWIRFWNNHDDLSDQQLVAIESEIADGHPVAVGMRWPNDSSFSSASPFMLKVPPRDKIFDGHCVALVGYVRAPDLPGGGAFMFRNSWGEGWADHGYAWMPFALLRFCINDALSIRLWKPLSPAASASLTFQASKMNVENVTGDPPRSQDMRPFGPWWSDGQQLFFPANQPGQGFSLDVPVERAGIYEVRLIATRAQDYGTFKVAVAGVQSLTVPTVIDGAGPGVSRSTPIPCGRYPFKAGLNQICLTVTGHGPASTGLFVGIDSVQLVPVAN